MQTACPVRDLATTMTPRPSCRLRGWIAYHSRRTAGPVAPMAIRRTDDIYLRAPAHSDAEIRRHDSSGGGSPDFHGRDYVRFYVSLDARRELGTPPRCHQLDTARLRLHRPAFRCRRRFLVRRLSVFPAGKRSRSKRMDGGAALESALRTSPRKLVTTRSHLRLRRLTPVGRRSLAVLSGNACSSSRFHRLGCVPRPAAKSKKTAHTAPSFPGARIAAPRWCHDSVMLGC